MEMWYKITMSNKDIHHVRESEAKRILLSKESKEMFKNDKGLWVGINTSFILSIIPDEEKTSAEKREIERLREQKNLEILIRQEQGRE